MPPRDAANEAIASDEDDSFVSATSSPTSPKIKLPPLTLPTKPKPIPTPKPAALGSYIPAPSALARPDTEATSTDAASTSTARAKPPASAPRPKTAVRPKSYIGKNPPASRSQYYPNAMPYGNSVVAAPAQPILIQGGPPSSISRLHRPPPRPSPKSMPSSRRNLLRDNLDEVPLETMTGKGMSLDCLANAMVASNLATSRTASRTASPLYPSSTGGSRRPPVPPPTRRSGGSVFDSLKPSSHRGSRAGSPSKEPQKRKMMTTLRKEKSEDDGKYKTKGLIKKKHPNKHHEGDRKRWRDTVTEKERKRYEGLWASNKGLWIGQPVVNPAGRVRRDEPRPQEIDSMRPSSSYGEQPYQVDRDPYLRDRSAQSVPMLAKLPSHPYSQQNASSISLGGAGPYSHPSSQGNLSSLSLATASGSNSGSYTSSPQRTSPSRYYTPFDKVEPQDCVCSLVVRDIWSRSRLPPDVLSDIWDLVDRTGTGMLCKDEFCVGLWLIDQRLKGRKLPQRVGDGVWRSFGGMANIKIRDYGGKDKKSHGSESGRRS